MTFLPAFGRLELASKCVYPWSSGARWPKRGLSPQAAFGRAISDVAACATAFGDAPLDAIADAHDLTTTDRRRFNHAAWHVCKQLEDEAGWTDWRKAETTLAYDHRRRTARELPQLGPTDYSQLGANEYQGRPDLVFFDGELVVRDWKTGRYRADAEPKEDRQLRALGLAAARAYGYNSVRLELAQVDEYGVRIKPGDLDCFDLELVASQLSDLEAVISKDTVPHPGRWCSRCFCPLGSECPATQVALEQLRGACELRFPLTTELTSDEHAGYVLERLAVIDDAVSTLRGAVKGYATHTPIPLDGGKIYANVEHTERSIALTPEAIAALSRFGASDAIEQSVTLAGIMRAIKESVPKGQAAATERALVAELEKLGCVRERTFFAFTDVTPRQEEEEPHGNDEDHQEEE